MTRATPMDRPLVRRSAVVLLLAAMFSASDAVAERPFDDLSAEVAGSLATQSESTLLTLLDAGLAEHKPTQAAALAQRWLRDNVANDVTLLYKAGRAAELSGDWRAAASLYRQFLTRADLTTPAASDAVLAVYTLLLNQLDDADSAYAYARTDGHRLATSAQARQFDRWFLDEARRRDDREAVAARLLALVEAKVSTDLLVAHYEADFRWLLDSVRTARLDEARFTPDFVQTTRTLASKITFDDELRLSLAFDVSAKAYNMALLAGEQASAPVAEASALLQQFPHQALHVQTVWAGGSRSRHFRGDRRKYWPLELDTKLEPVRAAVAKLSPAGQAAFHQSWSHNYYDTGPHVIEPDRAIAWVLANPKLANTKTAPRLQLGWNKLSFADATKLAPHLERNPSPEAALVRAIVAAGEDKNLDKALNALLTTEAWRLSYADLGGAFADQLWHWAGRPGNVAARDKAVAQSKKIADAIARGDALKTDPADKRLAAFATLWKDYSSDQPQLPTVRQRLTNLLRFTPEALPELLKQTSPDAQLLVREVLEAGASGATPADAAYERSIIGTDRYDPCFRQLIRQHGMRTVAEFKQNRAAAYHAHPLGPAIEQALGQQVKQNSVQSWLVLAWLNTRFPETDESSAKLMNELVNSPAWKTMPYEVRFGARDWFKRITLTPPQLAYVDAADPALICKDLLSLPKDADAATTAAALQKTIDALRAAPVRTEIRGLDRLAGIDQAVLADPQVYKLILELAGPLRSFQPDWAFGERLVQRVQKRRDAAELHQTAAYLWRITEVQHRPLPSMIDLAESLVSEHPSAAQTLATSGLQTIGRYKTGHTYFNRETDIPRLKSVRGKAMLAMGLIDIPVAPNHPAYNVFKSQSEFAIGNEESARELLVDHTEQLVPVHRKLSVPYLLWVLRYTIDQRDQVRQEELAKALLAWMTEAPSTFSIEQRVELEIAYGDIALQRGMLPEAHRIYTRVRKNPAYESVYAHHTAALRSVLVDRISGTYDQALQTLLELESAKIPRLTTAVQYERAEVFYAMEDYERAAEQIVKVLERDPDHADATILRGRVQLKLQRLIEATEVELGSTTGQESLVPGEMLKVTLNDPTLSVSSGASDIEVVVWATSGDREYLLLRQFGDQKTKFRGEIRTALGKPVPDDNALQVIGDDEVFYAYSERFRQKMVDLDEHRGGPIKIASDAITMASARRLLTENEQRAADMRAATELLSQHDQAATREKLAELQAEAAQRARREMVEARVKPGNPIHLRVTDPDRSRTGDVDQLEVSVSSSSGDLIGQVVLKESDTHSGRFEGQVQTAKAQPIAMATSTETGRDPNMVISPKADYPAWRPVADKNARHAITIDLNDNAALGSLTIDARDQGHKLKQFLVQTALDGSQWTTVATYPAARTLVADPTRPSVTVVNEEGRRAHYGARSVYELTDLRQHMETGWLAAPDQALAMNVAGPSQALPKSVLTEVNWQRHGRWANPAVVVKFEAFFYEPQRVNRRFALQLGKYAIKAKEKQQDQAPEFLLAVNGAIITSAKDGKLEGGRDLRPGVHKLEIWATGWVENIGFGRDVKLLANLNEPEAMVECPDSFFDPASFPPGTIDPRNGPATLKPLDDGSRFTVDFAPNAKARLIRVVPVAFEGPVPSINHLALTDAQGAKLLPVPTDYAELRKNDRLEIVSGDRITVRYIDDRYVTKGKQKHERFLNAAYTDGQIEFADIEPRFSSRHNANMPYHELLLRFALGKPVPIVVHDADMDVSVEPDRVAVIVTGAAGQQRELIAEETGASTGVFRALITPVTDATADAGQIQVDAGGTLLATYRDLENLRPGVPHDRAASIQHAAFHVPRIEVASMTVGPIVPQTQPTALPATRIEALNERLEPNHLLTDDAPRNQFQDQIETRYLITQEFKSPADAPAGGLSVVHGRHALIDVVAPDLALGAASSLDIYVQTEAGRRAAGKADGAEFDPNVPGTIRVTGEMNAGARVHVPQRGGYLVTFAQPQPNDYERSSISLQTGRFRVAVPIITGTLPEQSFAKPDGDQEQTVPPPHGLIARTGEQIHIGVPYTDPQGVKRWATASAKVITQAMLDVMTEDYRNTVAGAHVGEKLYLRVVDLAADRTDARDSVKVYVASKSGQKHYMVLDETDAHSGVFKGVCTLAFADKTTQTGEDYDVRRDGLPVNYGDTAAVRYTDPSGAETPVPYVSIAKGSDGTVVALSKRYDDDETAMRTQFAMAESYLELADRHHKLNESDAAERELSRARQLLAAVVAQFTDPETRSHAEYLLGNMTMADAERVQDRQMKEDRYHAALARFMTVTGTYPDTEWAARAQFQTAVVYEQLGEPDVAAQEYVKLAYKYPESENLATAMARLGTHFQRKAVGYEEQVKPLAAKTDDKDAQFEAQVLTKLATKEYIKAAQIFERLQSRFPDHVLAGKSGLRAGQIYMRAEQYSDAIKVLQSVIDNESYDGASLRSEAMYWAGRCHQLTRQQMLAYALFKRITYDFPESQWAAYARAQLSTEAMLQLDQKLEIERLESGR